jgi:RNA polymerase sigma-70 factor (sigma-E family)
VDGPVNDAFADFVTLRYGDLLRTAYLLTGSHHVAEDLVQACLLKAMSRWNGIAEPMAYLRRAMVNERISWWRRLRRELLRADPPDAAVAADDIGAATERAVVLEALADLPQRMRVVLVLRYWEDLSESETAEVLGCSLGTVKSQSSRGLARLRVALGGTSGEIQNSAPAGAANDRGRE